MTRRRPAQAAYICAVAAVALISSSRIWGRSWSAALVMLSEGKLADKPKVQVVIIGGGPAGLALAYSLLDTQIPVHLNLTLVEKQSVPGAWSDEVNPTSYGLGLGARAQQSMHKVGLGPALAALRGTGVEVGSPERPMLLVRRGNLCQALWEALQTRARSIQGYHDFRLLDKTEFYSADYAHERGTVNLKDGGVHLEDDEELHAYDFDILVAADGVHSAVTQHALSKMSLLDLDYDKFARPHVWKALRIPAHSGLPLKKMVRYDPGGKSGGFGAALPQADGSHILLCFWNWPSPSSSALVANNPRGLNGDEVSDAEGLRTLLRHGLAKLAKEFDPDVIPLTTLDSFLQADAINEWFVRVGPAYHVPMSGLVFLGDAAHGGYSLLGQGFAVAMGDVAALHELMLGYNSTDDLEDTLSAYSERRVPEGRSCQELNLCAHLLYNRWTKRFVAKPIMNTMLSINNPKKSYKELLRAKPLLFGAARCLWMSERIPLSSPMLRGRPNR